MILTINSKTHGIHDVLIDDDDYEKIKDYKWNVLKKSNGIYIICTARTADRKRHTLRMQRVIMNCNSGMDVDHVNGNTLDNRKSNLRICTHTENMRNMSKRKNVTSVYKGVYFNKSRNKWTASIRINGTLKHLGHYKTEDQAAISYNISAVKYFGEFARPNINIMMRKAV